MRTQNLVWMILLLVGIILPGTLLANVFASQIKITNPDGSPFDGSFSDGTAAQISFFLNDTATGVDLEIIEVESQMVVYSRNLVNLSAGKHIIEWDGTGTEGGKSYLIKIAAEQPNYSSTEWTLFFDSGDIDIYTRGVAVVRNMKDPNFGLIFTSNDGGPLGTGINIYNPDGSFHDPFLVAADLSSGGSFDYGTDAPLFAVIDSTGRLYVSLKDKGQIVRIDRDFTAQVLIDGLSFPKGLYVEGKGEQLTLYVAADNKVFRGVIGNSDSFPATNLETVAQFSSFYPHQIILDDEGFLYVTLRASNDLGSDGRGIRKYDLSGNLPVTDDQAVWFLSETKTFIANDLLMDYGTDRSSAADDILYFCTRAGNGNPQDGIWRVDDIQSFFPDVIEIMTEQTFYGSDENINARATMDFDAAGNIILMENSNEHVFFLSPPGTGPTNRFTTYGADTIHVAAPTAVDNQQEIIRDFRLFQNFPNPFNPETTIRFYLPSSEMVTVWVSDIRGRTIRVLMAEKTLPQGLHTLYWDGKDAAGNPVSSGRYLYSIRAGNFRKTLSMTVIR